MRTFEVEAPAAVEVPPQPALGRLDGALRRLAAQQGAWPPAAPRQVVRVAGTDRPAGDADGLEAGAAAADRWVDAGADLLVVAGGGPRSPALVLLAAVLDRDPVSVVGTTPAPGWTERVVQVRDGLRAARPHLSDPRALLAAVGADEVAELCGVLLQAAVRRTPVLLSGAPDVWAAALLAQRLAPGTAAWLHAGCSPADPMSTTAVGELRLAPLLDLGIDEPLGAELALGVLAGAVELAHA